METNLNQRQDDRPRYVSLSDALQSGITHNAKGPRFANRTLGTLVYRNARARKAANNRNVARCSAMGALGDFEDRFDFHTDVFGQSAHPDRRAGVTPGLTEHFN